MLLDVSIVVICRVEGTTTLDKELLLGLGELWRWELELAEVRGPLRNGHWLNRLVQEALLVVSGDRWLLLGRRVQG